jgi:predicted phosphoribosyltransferase
LYFLDRFALGGALAATLTEAHDQGAIVICLKEGALLTCIEVAASLRAWIYPLVYETIADPDDPHSFIGAVTIDGDFCLSPNVSQMRMDYIQSEFMGVIETSKREAFSRVNRKASEYGSIPDKHVMNGRDVILLGDIMTDTLELAVVAQLLKPLSPKRIFGAAGNVTIDVSDMFHLESDKISFLDILPSHVFDDDHYFEKPDPYSIEQKRQLAQYVTKFWK